MFEKKDYLGYLKEVLKIEKAMQKEGLALRRVISEPRCQAMLDRLVADEVRHAEIVKDLINAVTKNK